jgi:hypothetical protein
VRTGVAARGGWGRGVFGRRMSAQKRDG